MDKFVQNDNNLAIAYYRYSSSGQNEASIDQQREQAHRFAESRGLKIIKEYEDAAIRGWITDRPQYQLMLKEIKKIRPSALILWKTDRLGRNKYELTDARRRIRNAGCRILYVAEANVEGSESILLESLMDGMAEFYSENLSQNVRRGLHYNAENGLYYRAILGYKKSADKRYIVDEDTAPVIRRIFNDYAYGKGMVEICEDLNKQGIKTGINGNFTVNSLRCILKNRSYIGEYNFAGVIIPDGMPALIPEALFMKAQDRLFLNKRKGCQKANGLDENEEPRYWLTGKLYCGVCGESMHGMSGTSKTKRTYYYYSCKNHRRKHNKCSKKDVSKELIENLVINVLKTILDDTENLSSLAVDINDYCMKEYDDDSYLKTLKSELKKAETSLNNIVKALEAGIFSETTQQRLMELEEQKKSLTEAIQVEEIKQNIKLDTISIKKFFDKYKNADFSDTRIRDTVLEYFVDKIYVYDDKLIVCCFYTDSIENGYQVSLKDIDEKFERSLSNSARNN